MTIAYIDPGTGSMLISATIAMVSVVFFMLKGFIYRKFSFGGDKGETLNPDESYGLVFYSEGKQYWNVFKALLEESSRRGIDVVYMTSDKEDPGLQFEMDHVCSIFIGSGKESIYNLNRLKADLVVLTTPGLDVLEIKRSKNVKHYSHITHAPGCMAGYKAFAVDYYDSVLLGGDADIPVLRELEALRSQKPKQIEVIGQTYLDVLREKSKSLKIETPYFDNERKTVLLSPTWSNHGLLMKYGDEMIQALIDADTFNIIVRPHPQSFISEKDMIEPLMKKFPANKHLVWDRSVENLSAMAQSDIMISDFSGIIFDYFTLFKRPIISLNEHYEKRGRDVIDLKEDSWDVKMLSVIGKTITGKEITNVPNIIDEILNQDFQSTNLAQKTLDAFDKYPNEAAKRGMDFFEKTLKEITKEEKDYTQIKPNKANFSVQVLMSMMLMNLYMYLGATYLPERGLNKDFLSYILPYATLITVATLCCILLKIWYKDKGEISFFKKKEKFDKKNFLMMLLPLMPIVQYIFSNQDIMSLTDSINVMLLFSVIIIFVGVIIPVILSPIINTSLSSMLTMSLLFVLFNMATFGRTTSQFMVGIILISLFLIVLLVLKFGKKKLLIGLVVIAFASNSIGSFIKGIGSINAYGELKPGKGLRFTELTKDLTIKNTPDIYLLTYDSYGNQETMEKYGWDNSKQVDYLLDEGFAVYDGTYSTGLYSLSSIGKLLSPETKFYNLKSLRTIVAGDAAGFVELKENGYDMSIISQNDYMLKGTQSQYDFTYPEANSAIEPSRIIIDAVIEGEFSSDANFSKITYEEYLEVNNDLLAQKSNKPRFIYKHGSRPGHTPNVGTVQDDAVERYMSRLQDANEEMRKDIETIRQHDKDAIIAVLGDHGPYLTKDGKDLSKYESQAVTQKDIQDRFGTFLAISWPEEGYYNRYQIETIQDLFPSFLAYMYEDDSLFEKTKIPSTTTSKTAMSGVYVKEGIIYGGSDNGKPLFDVRGIRIKE